MTIVLSVMERKNVKFVDQTYYQKKKSVSKNAQQDFGKIRAKKRCDPCEKDCAKCANGTDCNKCKSGKVLYKGDCLSSCPSRWESSNYVCRKSGFTNYSYMTRVV